MPSCYSGWTLPWVTAEPMGWLLLPCETRSREFDAKLLLAVVAAGRGIGTIVGAKKTMDLHLARYPLGVYVGKGVTARSRHNLLLARSCGHRVALWDEEGLVWASREIYWRTKVDDRTLNTPELLLAWGEENAAAWREHPAYGGPPIAVTGNPRADLLRPALHAFYRQEVERLQQEHGRFILVNTNFSRVNHLQPRQSRHLKWLREQRPDDPRGGFAAHKHSLFQAFLSLLPALSEALPEVRIVIRPHPSEALEVWHDLSGQLPNVCVRRQGSVAAWLLAAEAMVHNGCTTAVEAFALGCPALAYMPVRSAAYDHPLPNGVSLQSESVHDLVSQVTRCMKDRGAAAAQQRQDEARHALMARGIAGFDGPETASVRICRALAPLLEDDAGAGRGRRLAGTLLAARRVAHAVEGRIPGAVNYRPYLTAMFPDVSLEDVRARAGALATCVGLPMPPVVNRLQPNVFTLTPG